MAKNGLQYWLDRNFSSLQHYGTKRATPGSFYCSNKIPAMRKFEGSNEEIGSLQLEV